MTKSNAVSKYCFHSLLLLMMKLSTLMFLNCLKNSFSFQMKVFGSWFKFAFSFPFTIVPSGPLFFPSVSFLTLWNFSNSYVDSLDLSIIFLRSLTPYNSLVLLWISLYFSSLLKSSYLTCLCVFWGPKYLSRASNLLLFTWSSKSD